MGDTLRNKKAFRRGRIIVFVTRFCSHPFQKELPVFGERNKREDHFGFAVRFTISRIVITCTVREFNKPWILDAQTDPRASLRAPLEARPEVSLLITRSLLVTGLSVSSSYLLQWERNSLSLGNSFIH
jgi:hypothetical protein